MGCLAIMFFFFYQIGNSQMLAGRRVHMTDLPGLLCVTWPEQVFAFRKEQKRAVPPGEVYHSGFSSSTKQKEKEMANH